MTNFDDLIADLIILARMEEKAPDWALTLKLAEECGEVSEVVLYENGFIQHKQLKEDLFHEVADVINVCTAILAQHYSEMSTIEIHDRLIQAVETKGAKYAKILREGCNG